MAQIVVGAAAISCIHLHSGQQKRGCKGALPGVYSHVIGQNFYIVKLTYFKARNSLPLSTPKYAPSKLVKDERKSGCLTGN